MSTNTELKEAVKEKYGSIAKNSSSCCGPTCCCGSNSVTQLTEGYKEEEMAKLPEGADLGLGCGFPTRAAKFEKGQTVLDLGSGAGVDVFLAADAVGPTGKVIGVDMTQPMIDKARENARKKGIQNVEFRLGEIENLPVESNTVDIVISNCVLNLVPDKNKAFAEIFRVLKPKGYFVVSDIVYEGEMPEEIKKQIDLYTGCVAGAVRQDQYLEIIDKTGFKPVRVLSETQYDIMATENFHGKSITVQGIKPE